MGLPRCHKAQLETCRIHSQGSEVPRVHFDRIDQDQLRRREYRVGPRRISPSSFKAGTVQSFTRVDQPHRSCVPAAWRVLREIRVSSQNWKCSVYMLQNETTASAFLQSAGLLQRDPLLVRRPLPGIWERLGPSRIKPHQNIGKTSGSKRVYLIDCYNELRILHTCQVLDST